MVQGEQGEPHDRRAVPCGAQVRPVKETEDRAYDPVHAEGERYMQWHRHRYRFRCRRVRRDEAQCLQQRQCLPNPPRASLYLLQMCASPSFSAMPLLHLQLSLCVYFYRFASAFSDAVAQEEWIRIDVGKQNDDIVLRCDMPGLTPNLDFIVLADGNKVHSDTITHTRTGRGTSSRTSTGTGTQKHKVTEGVHTSPICRSS